MFNSEIGKGGNPEKPALASASRQRRNLLSINNKNAE